MDRRNQYRVPSRVLLRATLELLDEPYKGVIRDTSAGGLSVEFLMSAAPPLQLGGQIRLEISGELLPLPLRCDAAVISRRDVTGFVRFGFAFEDADAIIALMPHDLRQSFNRRGYERIASPAGGVPVTVMATEGPALGRRILGRLLDVSTEGLGVLLAPSAEQVFADSPTVVCTYLAPGTTEEIQRPCEIKNRSLEAEEVRYGMRFLPVEVARPAASPQTFETAWDCQTCQTSLLLGQTHSHCPQCGVKQPRGVTYFPEWTDAAPSEDHWAWGTDRTCAFCARGHGDMARFCGHCGKPLP